MQEKVSHHPLSSTLGSKQNSITELLIQMLLQWISEVLHFCQGLPIILVGCKKDLRYDQKTIEELHKTSQKPVTPEQVRFPSSFGGTLLLQNFRIACTRHNTACSDHLQCSLKDIELTQQLQRAKKSRRRSAQDTTSNAQRKQTKVSERCLSTRHAQHCYPRKESTVATTARREPV